MITVGSTPAPRVSVVMSVYNGARHLQRAVDSVLQQTWTDFEFLIINDGSTDSTAALLNAIATSDRRVRVITQPNAGLTRALIRGCVEARGELIARQDADDWSEPDRFREQVALLDSDPNFGFVSCATQYVGPNDEALEVISRQETPADATRKLLDERLGPPAHGSVMFRRSLYEKVGGYRPEFYFGQDSDLWLRMAEQSLIAYAPHCLYTYRRDTNSVSGRMSFLQHSFGELGRQCSAARQSGQSEEPFLATSRRLCETARSRCHQPGSHAEQSTIAYLIGTTLYANGDPRARTYFWQAATRNPLNWRAWCRLVSSMLPRVRSRRSTPSAATVDIGRSAS